MCSLYYVPLFMSPQFGGLEAVITGVYDIVPWLAKRRWVRVPCIIIPLYLLPQFGGLEAVITGVCDIVPWLAKRRWVCVLMVVVYCFLGSLPTTTYVSINSSKTYTVK